MSEPVWITPPEKTLEAARRQFVDIHGSTQVMNTYLKIAVVALCAVCLGLTVVVARAVESARRVDPVVIRINEVGRADAVSLGSLAYRPQEREIKFFLIDFITRHYSRLRATVRTDHARSLFFLDGRLADATIEENRKSRAIETFLVGDSPEVDITVRNVSIEDLRTSPYRATVEFEKIYFSYPDHREQKRERYLASLVFVVRDQVPNAMIPVNPLGLTINYFRLDQAFQ